MRKLWIIPALFIIGCGSGDKNPYGEAPNRAGDTTAILTQYWTLSDAEHPLQRDVMTKEDGVDLMPGLVFMTNGEILENPGGLTLRGTYERNGTDISVRYNGGQGADYKILAISEGELQLERTVGSEVSTLKYQATDTWWPDVKTNPFESNNTTWMQKPAQAETDAQILQRCKDYVQFLEYYLEGYARGGSTRISFVGLPNVLNFYQGGIGLQSDKNLNLKWKDCFYNDDDAMKGYAKMRHVMIQSYTWDPEEPNWIIQAIPVLRQIHENLE
ncbi:MAG: hypothetical protein J5I50_01475 [Chitinophagaceae bacterium]|nr:hypothetical protein [Chitinophagaceae bacterium]